MASTPTKNTHYAVAVDDQGRFLGHREFPANDRGYQQLLTWMLEHGDLVAIGVESTGSFGATLTRFLTAQYDTRVPDQRLCRRR